MISHHSNRFRYNFVVYLANHMSQSYTQQLIFIHTVRVFIRVILKLFAKIFWRGKVSKIFAKFCPQKGLSAKRLHENRTIWCIRSYIFKAKLLLLLDRVFSGFLANQNRIVKYNNMQMQCGCKIWNNNAFRFALFSLSLSIKDNCINNRQIKNHLTAIFPKKLKKRALLVATWKYIHM